MFIIAHVRTRSAQELVVVTGYVVEPSTQFDLLRQRIIPAVVAHIYKTNITDLTE